MTSISVTNKLVTFITVYEAASTDQQHLIDLLTRWPMSRLFVTCPGVWKRIRTAAAMVCGS